MLHSGIILEESAGGESRRGIVAHILKEQCLDICSDESDPVSLIMVEDELLGKIVDSTGEVDGDESKLRDVLVSKPLECPLWCPEGRTLLNTRVKDIVSIWADIEIDMRGDDYLLAW
jgi:hypothetical protein